MRGKSLFHAILAVSLTIAAGVWLAAAGPAPLRSDADQFKQKLASISGRAEAPMRQSARTTVTEREVNAYLAFEKTAEFPTGVVDPSVSLLGNDRVMGRAVVDLDKVRQQRNPTSLLDPMRYLRGRLQVSATGFVRASNGVGTFELESADVAGVPIPKILLQEIVSYYSRTAEHPSGYSLDDKYDLPARIREIHLERAQAIVIQ